MCPRDIENMKFKSIGKNVLISKNAVIYRPENITLGNNVRIDDFATLSPSFGGLHLGSYVHLSNQVYLAGTVNIGDCTNLSFKSIVFSRTDDISGSYMVGACIDEEFTNITDKPVKIGSHVFVGPMTVVLPGSILQNGVAVGVHSLVKGEELVQNGFYVGIPCKKIGFRHDRMYELEQRMKNKHC